MFGAFDLDVVAGKFLLQMRGLIRAFCLSGNFANTDRIGFFVCKLSTLKKNFLKIYENRNWSDKYAHR